MATTSRTVFDAAATRLAARALPEGGFPALPGGDLDPSATAWATLGLWGRPEAAKTRESGLSILARIQSADGRVVYNPARPTSWWPTTAALLAWKTDPAHADNARKAASFLLSTTGLHWPKEKDAVTAHDTAIRGWPWIENTHSWVEPTSLAVLGLAASGLGGHARTQEAARMLLDRQIPTGGWNYGNTMTLGAMLLPTEESTGLALAAMAAPGVGVSRPQVDKSLEWLASLLPRLNTPLSLSWAALGLSAWKALPAGFSIDAALADCLERETSRGGYETSLLGQLLLAAGSPAGLFARFSA